MDFESFDQLESLLYDLSKEPHTKKSAPLISPAIYKEPHGDKDDDSRKRRNVNVKEWAGWACLDVDDYEGDYEAILDSINYRWVCYSTASSTKELPKFRLVFELTENVPAEDIKAFWFALNKECLTVGDKQTKDLSRMYYIPAQYKDAYNFIRSNDGPLMDPQALMKKHPYTIPSSNSFFDQLPAHMQEKYIEQRKAKLTNTDVSWTSYRDCPFVNDQHVLEYMRISGSGWYHKMYTIMVSIAANAVRREYPITAKEIADLARQIDADNGGWYKDRPMEVEANRALEFVFRG